MVQIIIQSLVRTGLGYVSYKLVRGFIDSILDECRRSSKDIYYHIYTCPSCRNCFREDTPRLFLFCPACGTCHSLDYTAVSRTFYDMMNRQS